VIIARKLEGAAMATFDAEIRRYRTTDHDAVVDLHLLALRQVHAEAGRGRWDDDLDDIENVYLDGTGEFLVATQQDRLVGMGALRRFDDRTGEIKRMRVHPDFQRQGIAQAILDLLTEQARGIGYRKLRLDTTILQTAAQALYEQNGFVVIARVVLGGVESIVYETADEIAG
jgi:ribosomal protein S18 acetylase RimI-like enzyme